MGALITNGANFEKQDAVTEQCTKRVSQRLHRQTDSPTAQDILGLLVLQD